jgi:hypothetical protein
MKNIASNTAVLRLNPEWNLLADMCKYLNKKLKIKFQFGFAAS